MRRMRVVAVGVDQHQRPLLLLQEAAGRHRMLPVWIEAAEANAIVAEQPHVPTPRPHTHALIAGVILACGHHLRQVSITALRENTFYAELILNHGIAISARVSDAVALALHLDVPIQAEESVLRQAGLPETDVHTLDAADLGNAGDTEVGDIEAAEIARLREFLDTATPEDFDPS